MSAQIVASNKQKTNSGAGGLGSIAELLASASQIGTALGGSKSKQTRSGSTKTSGLDISQAGVDKVLSDILSGTSGLAEVSSGQKRAGLYNSTTNQQLTNDLTSRTAGEVAKLQAKTVTTDSGETITTQQLPTIDPLTAALTVAGGTLANNVLKDGGIDGVLNAVGSLFGGGSDDAASSLVSGVQGLFGSGSGLGFIDSAASGALATDFLGAGTDSLFGGLDFLGGGDLFGGAPILGIASDLLSGNPEDALGTGAGFLIGNALLPGFGGVLGSTLSNVFPVGDILSTIGGGFGEIFGGSVVCTELQAQGLMSKYLLTVDTAYARKYMEERTLNGYRFWGIPLVKLMRKSPRVTRIAAWFAVARAHYVVSKFDDGFYNAKLARRGKIINAIGVPLCNLIASVTTPKDWTQLYNSSEVKAG